MKKKRETPIYVTRPYLPDIQAYIENLASVWDSRQLTNGGPLVRRLEAQLCERLGVAHMVLSANGHLALDAALRALNLSGEVITTPFTFASTAHAVSMNGLTPVFCDIKESDCTIDEEKIIPLITDKTCAILPVHVYGFPCNTERVAEIADTYGLKVIYDAAHAFGVTVNGRGIGSFGDASMFSFHATKVFHTVEGGGLAFGDETLRPRLAALQNFGLTSKEDASYVGYNAKMTEFHAAMGLANLETLDCQIAQRRLLAEHYIRRLSGVPGIRVFSWSNDRILYNYSYFPVLFDDSVLAVNRDEIAFRMEREYQIYVRKYFYPLLSDLTCYRSAYQSADTPVARKIAARVLTLPLYAELTLEEADAVCDAILTIISDRRCLPQKAAACNEINTAPQRDTHLG